MPAYSLLLQGIPDSVDVYLPAHELPHEMRVGDKFEFDESMWQVAEATKQFDAGGEPELTLLRCIAL